MPRHPSRLLSSFYRPSRLLAPSHLALSRRPSRIVSSYPIVRLAAPPRSLVHRASPVYLVLPPRPVTSLVSPRPPPSRSGSLSVVSSCRLAILLPCLEPHPLSVSTRISRLVVRRTSSLRLVVRLTSKHRLASSSCPASLSRIWLTDPSPSLRRRFAIAIASRRPPS